jgi:GTP-binding protein Era
MAFKSGFVAIIGRPNAGKSTLVNALVGQKVAIVTPKAQTTRNRIQGIVNREDAQIVLVDTPGLHRPTTALGRQMIDEVRQAVEGVDIISLVVDASVGFGAGDRAALEWVKRCRGPVFLLLNKIDRIPKSELLPLIARYRDALEFAEIVPISALKQKGLEDLVKSWISYLPQHPAYFTEDQFTDQPERFLAAEYIREKAILSTREEVPHSVGVLIDTFREGAKLLRIRATIYVEREGQKGILIGRGGEMLKKIGTEARKELEKLFGIKIFLELYVKVQENWRQRPAMVRQFDWRRQMEELSERQAGTEDPEISAQGPGPEPKPDIEDNLDADDDDEDIVDMDEGPEDEDDEDDDDDDGGDEDDELEDGEEIEE